MLVPAELELLEITVPDVADWLYGDPQIFTHI